MLSAAHFQATILNAARIGPTATGAPSSSVVQLTAVYSIFPWVSGEYQFDATGLPFGYYVKSIIYGDADLLRVPLKVDSPTPASVIRTTLTQTAPPGTAKGVTVRGKVTGTLSEASGPHWVSLAIQLPSATARP